MISHLRGQLVEALPNQLVIECNGVGYRCFIPLTTYDKLAGATGEVKLLTHYHVTEHDHTLYGFATSEERDLFKLLIDRVSGIGPKMALAVLSGMPVSNFKDNVIRNDIAALSKINGVGKKTAERIVLELKDKVGIVSTWQAAQSSTASLAPDPTQAVQTDAVLALITLGFKQTEAQKTVQDLMKKAGAEADKMTVDKLIRDALRGM
ncbi:Holliday junction DNA helicase subunit RuvA [Roseimicrobium gellanilyticum]|uniref:Holliday junction branch migration complex subunit RuvA n=1 Tax=Roseimicrobium gellanilyticum TaxID=748857 RepID=A0A366HIQ1_9BACT|nr:Holliday junction branch migration protein RuvA [Roseimicrobium gellanilyticum]RBP42636.1 Holliday junction DNA helicase subunit RuvA [Roseimicrobium gellanilyticum]